jgi:hypothetical protein
MLILSRQNNKTNDKEVNYVHGRTLQYWCAYISTGAYAGHEGISHGPLFSAQRNLRWNEKSIIFQAILMAWEGSSTLKDRFRYARDCLIKMFPCRRRPGKCYQGFIKARTKLTQKISGHLQKHLGQHHQQMARSFWRIGGWVPLAVDGSLFKTPRTKSNQAKIGCAGRDKAAPQITATVLYQVETGLPWDWQMGSGKTSERSLLRRMLSRLPQNSLLIGDAGFIGFELFQKFLSHNISFLIRLSSRVTLLTGLVDLGLEHQRQGNIVWIWPGNKRRQKPLTLRLIRLKVKNKSKYARGLKEVYLITNILKNEALSDELAGEFYKKRWGIEVLFRSFKESFEQRKLRSRAPQQSYDELHWCMVSLLLLAMMSVSALLKKKKSPSCLSITSALRIVRYSMRDYQAWRSKGDIRVLLTTAVLDQYQRSGSKQSRDWPRQKQESPPLPPKIRPATEHEITCAKRIYGIAS